MMPPPQPDTLPNLPHSLSLGDKKCGEFADGEVDR